MFWTYFYENEKRRPFDGGGKRTTWIDSDRNVLLENNPDTWLRNFFSDSHPLPSAGDLLEDQGHDFRI